MKTGKYAAGFVSYEASPAFDEANSVNETSEFPLLWFGIYDSAPEPFDISENKHKTNMKGVTLKPEISTSKYLSDVGKIKKYIEEGDIYQANFTFRSIAPTIAEPYELFLDLINSHPVPYSAYINAGQFQIISLSPELFLEKHENEILSIPMKGTAHRALTCEEDKNAAEALAMDIKNRAENIMIVDMVRNDLGRICSTGSIKADPLFHVDTYSSVHQMISEVSGSLKDDVSISGIFRATFPAASITGAPKIRAMEIIKELEESPRKIYTGTIGCITPDSDFCFNVSIRTLICSEKGAELGIGSGVVADSVPEDEWQESLLKSRFLTSHAPEFEMLETMLFKNNEIVLLKQHIKRMRSSQLYFRRKWDEDKVCKTLEKEIDRLDDSADFAKIRLLVDRNSEPMVEVTELASEDWGKKEVKIKLSEEQTNSQDVFLYHKTTNRDFYNNKFKEALYEGYDEVVFTNEKMEITEGAISNIFIRKKGKWITPHLFCGLLPGVERERLLRELNAEETVISPEDLKSADKILICNSVRGTANASL